MIPGSSSLLLLFSQVMHSGHGNYLEAEDTPALLAASSMCGRLVSHPKVLNIGHLLKVKAVILQKLLSGNVPAACWRHLTHTCLGGTQL